ncbi:MAG: DUF6457 domain-containing protein [Actinomycetota bacterium]
MDAKEWLAAYADRLGADAPDDETTELLLELAGVAAHSSERIAAPITCWLIGVAGRSPAEALTIAKELAGEG